MLHRKAIALLIVIVTFNTITFAQNKDVRLLSSPRKDSILLRWAPTNSQIWRLGNQYGYIVKRYTVLQGKKVPKDIHETVLTPTPIKPVSIEEWEKYADTDKYITIAAECIFGSTETDIPATGNPYIAYQKYREEEQRFSYALFSADQSVKAAKLSGLYFCDKSALYGEKYLYRIYINTPDSIVKDTAFSFTGLSEYKPLPKPLDLKVNWTDKKAELSWNIRYLNSLYNSYFLEKSTDGGKTYFRTSETPIVQVADKGINPERMYKTDTLTDNKSVVYYRVRGISTFGEIGPPSDSVFGKGALPITSAPIIISHDVINNKNIVLKWDYPMEMNDYITGFKVYRSSKPKGRKDIVYEGKSGSAREFIDSTADFTNYYMISVYNGQTEKFSSVKTYAERVDSFPPSPPTGIWGKVDSTGRVILSWNSNTENDMDGYRVYRANDPKFEFQLVAPAVINDTCFSDSININTLTENIYYKVRAIDVRMNQSDFSNLLSLKRPDIIPPVSPVVKNIKEAKDGLEITWVNSSSSDVVSHKIFKKEKQDSLFNEIASILSEEETKSTFTDKKISPAKEYVYYIAAIDDDGNQSSPSNYGYFKTPSKITENIKLKKRTLTDKIKLTWEIKSDKEVQRVIVYRAVGNDHLHVYGNSEEDSFTDKKISLEKTYKYAIKAIYKDGSSSQLSKTIIVKM